MNRCSRISVLLLASAIGLCAAVLPSFGRDRAKGTYSVVSPDGEKEVLLSISGKDVPYFQLAKSGVMRITLQGPGDLKVISRLDYPAGISGAQGYTLATTDKERIAEAHRITTERSESVAKELRAAVGKSRKLSLHIPVGNHVVSFQLKDTSAPSVFLRFLYSPKSAAAGLAPLTPLAYSRVVTAVVNESLIAYFVATRDHQVKVRVIGPLQLRVDSRLNYDPRMTGEQKYAVNVTENGKTVRSVPQLALPSMDVMYKDWKEVVPGKKKTFLLDVPAGEHAYAFQLESGTGQSVSLRFEIPEGSVGNE